MTVLVAILLGVVQGITEFLPISSDGHLSAVPWLLGLQQPSLAFSVMLHIGTFVGVAVALKSEIGVVLRTLFGWGRASETERLLVRLIVIGTIPAGIAGLVLSQILSDNYQRPVLAGFMLLANGWILTSTEHRIKRTHEEPRRESVTTRDALIMGTAQIFALLPGISRSGTTIAAGVRSGLTRTVAARFSFLMSLPAILGAVIVEIPDVLEEEALADQALTLVAGIAAAAAAGFWALRWFLGLIGRVGLRPFGIYCWIAGGVVLLLATARA